MCLYNANDMAIAICNGILGVKGSYVPRKKVLTLTVNHDTWIKGCVGEAAKLSEVKSNSRILEDYKRKLLKGIYTIVDMNPLEEAHYYVQLKSGLAGYIYHGHVEIK